MPSLGTKFTKSFKIISRYFALAFLPKFESEILKFERKTIRRSIFVIDKADEQGQRSVYVIRDCSPQRYPTKYMAKSQAAKIA